MRPDSSTAWTPQTGASGDEVRIQDAVVEFDHEDGSVQRVLDHFSLTLAPGELLVLVGRSGCGKTTVLNLLAGLVTATSGTVAVAGLEPVAARSRIGYMFARDGLMAWRTAIGNVEFGLEIRGVKDRAERRRIATQALERVHLANAARKFPWQLSQGMRQRVALARTWALQPSLLLMDEPFSALDAQTRESVQAEFLKTWSASRASTVFVTHDLGEALLMADRIVLMKQGRIGLDVRVPFARPRDPVELAASAEFRTLERQLRDMLG